MFFSKKDPEITELKQKIGNLEIEIEKLKTHINSLRGLINRRRDQVLGEAETIKKEAHVDGLDSLRL